MRIESNTSAIQALQTRQGLRPGAPRPASPQTESTQAAPTESVSAGNTHLPSRQTLPVTDIQQTARQLGYLDISEQAIRKAYINGESLLADYRA